MDTNDKKKKNTFAEDSLWAAQLAKMAEIQSSKDLYATNNNDIIAQLKKILTELDKKANKTDLENYATKQELEESVAPDLSQYAKKDDVVTIDKLDNKADKTEVDKRVIQVLEGTKSGDQAKIQNQTDGGVMQYVSADKSNSAVTVNDGSQNVGAEICSLDPDGKGSRIIANKTGAYYSVGNAIDVTPEKEIAVKGDLAGFVNGEAIENKADKTDLEKYIPINNDKDGNKSYMANEKDGGIIKYIKPDESYAKVTLCNVDEEAVAQIVATNKDKTTFAKIDARKDGICYSKKTGNPNLEEDELVVKKDLKVYTPAEMEGLNPGDTAVCHNAKDGGSIKYMTETHTAFVGVDNGGDELFAEFALAENKQGKEFKKGNRLLAKKDGIFYTKDANSTTTAPEDEIITKKDIVDLATKTQINSLEATINNLTSRIEELEQKLSN